MVVYDLKTGNKLSIRKIKEADSAAVVELWDKLGSESDNLTFGMGEFYFTPEQQRAFICSTSLRDNCIYLCAIADGKIVGCLNFIASSHRRLVHRGDLGIGVLKAYWGQGVGSALMDYFMKWAGCSDIIKKIDLEVREDNLPAIALYLKYGFKIEGRVARGVCVNGKYYNLYHMGKEIG